MFLFCKTRYRWFAHRASLPVKVTPCSHRLENACVLPLWASSPNSLPSSATGVQLRASASVASEIPAKLEGLFQKGLPRGGVRAVHCVKVFVLH